MDLPDARDGLTRLERVILIELDRLSKELGPRAGADPFVHVPMLYGRVVEHVDVSMDQLYAALRRLMGKARP